MYEATFFNFWGKIKLVQVGAMYFTSTNFIFGSLLNKRLMVVRSLYNYNYSKQIVDYARISK